MKTEVYSWRVSSDVKTGLEREARRRKIPVSAALDLAVREWLEKSGSGNDPQEEQVRRRKAASKFPGSLASGHAPRSGEGVANNSAAVTAPSWPLTRC